MRRSGLNVRTIGQVVADYYGIDWHEIISARRTAPIVRPRQVTMWSARRHTTLSLPQIGRRCGGRDHTTVLHACRKIDHLRATDRDTDYELRDVEALLAEQEAQLAQRLITPDPDLDPFGIAERIVNEPSEEWCLTIPEIRALAQAVILRKPPVEEEAQQTPAPILSAPGVPDRFAGHLIDSLHESFRAYESARFSASERAARQSFEGALNALSQHFNHTPKGASSWNRKARQPRLPQISRTTIAPASSRSAARNT